MLASLPQVGAVALKAVLLYVTAVFLLRLGVRRTLARLSVVDVVVGGLVGRTITARDASWLEGATGLAVLTGCSRCCGSSRPYAA